MSFTVPRELRALLPAEAVVVAALVLLPLLPIALPVDPAVLVPLALLAAGTLSRGLRGRGWRELAVHPRTIPAGLAVGLVALAVATPLFGAFDVTAVEWWVVPAVADDPVQLARALGFAIASAAALELALRGWILERVWELSPGPPTLPIATAAALEALLLGGPIPSRIGAALFGAGLGLLYVGGGRSVLAPIAARATFAVGAIVVELMRS